MENKLPIPIAGNGGGSIVPKHIIAPSDIAACAVQLSPKELGQIKIAFENHSYEMVSAYVWTKAMSMLRIQMASLGMDFIGAMLQRPGLDEKSDLNRDVTDFEIVSLAEDMGLINPTEAMRLRHSHELVRHFSSMGGGDEEEMMPEEAVACLRSCVQAVLGQPKFELADNFDEFRIQLETKTFALDDAEFTRLMVAPYFLVRTILSFILTSLKRSSGAQLEHLGRNLELFLSQFWPLLLHPERWQVGTVYAELYSEGKGGAASAIKRVLIKVNGFDFVPENLRSNTFIKIANDVFAAHDGMNNFYNEPKPMSELASLGTTIPGPAVFVCVSAALTVRLGNYYGVSHAAQDGANHVLKSLSRDRWSYYLDECLPVDRRVLTKITSDKTDVRWVKLVREFEINPDLAKNGLVKELIELSNEKSIGLMRSSALKIYASQSGGGDQ